MEKSVQKRRMRSSITTTTRLRSIDDIISDDELIEILYRLPLDCVHRFKCVSKRWLNLISNPMFVNLFIRLRTNSAESLNPERCDDFLLYQVQHLLRPSSVTPIKHAELKPYSEYSPKTKYFDFSLGFLPILQYRKRVHIHDQLCSCTYDLRPRTEALRFFNLLKVYKGLMLCEAGFSYMSNILYVCDPLTKQWLELPPSPWSTNHQPTQDGTVGFLCNESVVSIIHLTGVQGHFSLDVFTTKAGGAIGKWRQICVPFMPDFRWAGNVEVVEVCKGKFYWNGKTSIVIYDPSSNPGRCDAISIPIDTTNFSNYSYHTIPRLAVSDGCIRIYRYGKLGNSGQEVLIWDLVDYDKREWSSKYKISTGLNSYFAGFSESNRSAFYTSPKRDDPNVMIHFMNMDGDGSTCKWIVSQKHPHKYGTRLIPYVMTLWPVSLRNFFNLTSTTREQEP